MKLTRMPKRGRTQIVDGDPVVINWKTTVFAMRCCDCGLVHDVYFKVKGSKLEITTWRDNRATAASRRHMRNVIVRKGK